jgi:hypothetical protein
MCVGVREQHERLTSAGQNNNRTTPQHKTSSAGQNNISHNTATQDIFCRTKQYSHNTATQDIFCRTKQYITQHRNTRHLLPDKKYISHNTATQRTVFLVRFQPRLHAQTECGDDEQRCGVVVKHCKRRLRLIGKD